MFFHRSTESIYHLFKRANASWNYHGVDHSVRPTLTFRGTVKLHGTNAGIRIEGVGKKPVGLARSRAVTVNSDNCGFAMFLESIPQEVFDRLYTDLVGKDTRTEGLPLTVFGEWCGSGVQGGVALSQVKKHFVIFAAAFDHPEKDPSLADDQQANLLYVPIKDDVHFNDKNIYNIGQIPRYFVDIDFSKGNQDDLVEELTKLVEEVEAECPWAKQMFDVSGVGEGLVFERADNPANSFWTFKIKGEKHAVRQGRDRNRVVAIDVEKVENVSQCVDIILTENRMLQMMTDNNFDYDPKNIGPFLKAVCVDCVKEEIDVVVENGLEWSDVQKVVQTRARNWFLTKSRGGE